MNLAKNMRKYRAEKLHPLTNNYLFKVNNKNTEKSCEICSKLTIKTLERRQWRCSNVFIVKLEHS